MYRSSSTRSLKTIVSLAILLICTIYLTLFTIKAYSVAPHIYEDPKSGEVYWRTTPPGTMFPWPSEPGSLEALSHMSYVDEVVYRYLVKSYAIVLVTVAMYVLTIYYVTRLLTRRSTQFSVVLK